MKIFSDLKHISFNLFLRDYFVFLIIFSLPVVFCISVLHRAFEARSYKDIVERQLTNNSIYGSSLNSGTYRYKLELVRRLNPEILILGSSRVMQFRQEFFKIPIVNAGGAANNLDEAISFLNEALKIQKPKLVILGLDVWWFNDRHFQPQDASVAASGLEAEITFQKIQSLWTYLHDGRFSFRDYLSIVTGGSSNSFTGYDNLGFAAIKDSSGYRKDGSYFYSKMLFGALHFPFHDKKFSMTRERIRSGASKFEYMQKVSPRGLKKIDQIAKLLRESGIPVIFFFPPFEASIWAEIILLKDKHSYIFQLGDLVRQITGLRVYNFHNPKTLNSDSCEFIDGFHGGDITYARILEYFHRNSGANSQTIKSIYSDKVSEVISRSPNKALAVFGGEPYYQKETDFLSMGCKK